jgi:hypothetical protein
VSDENPEMCKNETCADHEFKCAKTGRCIPANLKCDNENDCPDGEDEENCPETIKCDPQTEFQCADKKCVSLSWRCDSHNDCDDGSDEKDCPKNECTGIGEKKCDDGECITASWFCDGDEDCKDKSDEKNCTDTRKDECTPTQFQCSVPLISPECINIGWKCDGEGDCGDNSDELNCPNHTCEPGERKCDANYCIKEIFFCDGDVDCQDGTDEKDCNTTVIPKKCAEWQFDCNNDGLECIPDNQMCDGTNHCKDGRDESQQICPEDKKSKYIMSAT